MIKSWGGATIEKDKYYALLHRAAEIRSQVMLISFRVVVIRGLRAWNLKKIKEPTWYEKMMPGTTNWDKTPRLKVVGDLKFEDGRLN